MEWLNEPASWQRTGDVLTVSVDPGTDFWRETGYGYIRDSGHVYGEVLAGDLDVSVRLRCTLGVQYDQAGVMLRADERTWLKTGVEFFEGRPRLSTVLTLGRSSWMVTDLPESTDEIVLRVSRRGDAVEVRYVIEDGPAELAALVFLPPGREMLAGVMAAAPESPGFRVTFHDLRITERDWSAPAGDDATAWPAGQAPQWHPADGEPGWPVPETGEDAPEWPDAAAEPETPAWPVPAAGAEEGLDWAAPAGEAAEPAWSAETAADEPDWPATGADDDDPGWVATLAAEVAGSAGVTADHAEDDLPEPEPLRHDLPEPGPLRHDLPEPGPLRHDLAEPGPATADSAEPEAAGKTEPGPVPSGPAAQDPAGRKDEDSDHGAWSPAPVTGHEDRPGPAASDGPADVDPAADWERLAAGTQAAQPEGAGAPASPAAPWIAQTDADVANEWPGPPLRTAMRNGLLASDAAPGSATLDPVDDAQTDPGLPRPRAADPAEVGPPEVGPAEAEPGPPEASAWSRNGAATERAGPEGGTPIQGEPGEPAPSARASRRRSRRAAADQPTEPDAADEWISLLTADPVEE
jgi:uncharacterized protein